MTSTHGAAEPGDGGRWGPAGGARQVRLSLQSRGGGGRGPSLSLTGATGSVHSSTTPAGPVSVTFVITTSVPRRHLIATGALRGKEEGAEATERRSSPSQGTSAPGGGSWLLTPDGCHVKSLNKELGS